MSDLKINGFLIIVFFSLIFTACKSQSSGDETSTTKLAATSGVSNSGYYYEHILRNEGPKPVVGDRVEYHEIILKNDSLVRSTFLQLEPVKAVMPPREKVATPPPPSYDAVFLMSVGDSLITYHTLDTFRNYQLPGWLSPADTLAYHIKLMSLQPKAEIEAEQAEMDAQKEVVVQNTKTLLLDYQAGKLDDQIKTTESGLKYIIHEQGTGIQAEKGKFVKVNYAGFLTNGDLFDNSYKKGRPFPFQVGRGRVIEGWDQSLPFLKVGGNGTFFIPYELAYGEAGRPPSIPPKSDLVFHIELVEVLN